MRAYILGIDVAVGLSKFDLKGNLVIDFSILIQFRDAQGIETDGNHLWILSNDPGDINVNYLDQYDKKSIPINAYAPARQVSGITTNGKDLILCAADTNFHFLDKKAVTIRILPPSIGQAYRYLSFNGKDILATMESDATDIHVLEQRGLELVQFIPLTTATTPKGICSIHKQIAIIDSNNLDYYDYSGNRIRSTALPNPDGREYVDLCHDRDFLWMTANVPEIG